MLTLKCSNPECFYHTQGILLPEGAPAFEKCPLCQAGMFTPFQQHYLEAAAADPDLWLVSADRLWPSVIAYEYRRLHLLCEEKRPYAVLLCLKDNFESLLKLETLLSFAWAAQTMGEDFAHKTIALLTTPNLSLGAWEYLADVLLKNLQSSGAVLPDIFPLRTLLKCYRRGKIVNWRNTRLGHSAMALDEDPDFQRDLIDTLKILQQIYAAVDGQLRRQQLYCDDQLLQGAEMARNLPFSGNVSFKSSDGQLSFSADPYIVMRGHGQQGYGVYFFDNQKTLSTTCFQAYADGSHANENVGYFEMLRRMLHELQLDLGVRADDLYLTSAESHELDLLQMSHRFVVPEHLKAWLSDCIRSCSSGIFLLQMQRGLGKSVFTEKLNTLYDHPLVIDQDLDVRTYHFGRTQSAGIQDFYTQVEWMWSHQYDGDSWGRMPHIRDLESEGLQPAEAFSAFLDHVRIFSERTRGKRRLLMVLDGLDEMADRDMMSMIPAAAQLTEGIYLLLTRRLPEAGIPAALPGITASLNVARDSTDNTAFLEKYICQTSLKNLDAPFKAALISHSGRRILHLGLLCRMVESGLPVTAIPDAGLIAGAYLNMINERYGERESIFVRELLVILCTLGQLDQLSLQMLGQLTPENGVTLHVIGVMRDLAPLIRTEHSTEGTVYRIANPDLAAELAACLPETADTVREMCGYALAIIRECTIPEPSDAAEMLCAHVTELAERWLPGKIGELPETFDGMMKTFINDRKEHIDNPRRRRYLYEYRRQLYLFCCGRYGETDAKTLAALGNLAITAGDQNRHEEALRMKQKIYDIRRKLLGENAPETVKAALNLSVTLSKLDRHEEALSLKQTVYEKRLVMLGADHPDTLRAVNNLAVTYRRLRQYEKALELQRQVYDQRRAIWGKSHPDTVRALNNLSVTMTDLRQYAEAMPLQQQVFKLRSELLGPYDIETLRAGNNLGCTLNLMDRYEEGCACLEPLLRDCQKHLGEIHQLTLVTENNLARAFYGIGRYEDAVRMQEDVVQKSRSFYPEGHILYIRRLLALAVFRKACGRSCEVQCRELYNSPQMLKIVIDDISVREDIRELARELFRHKEANE